MWRIMMSILKGQCHDILDLLNGYTQKEHHSEILHWYVKKITLYHPWDMEFKRFHEGNAEIVPFSFTNRIAAKTHLKSTGYTNAVLFSTIGQAGDVMPQ